MIFNAVIVLIIVAWLCINIYMVCISQCLTNNMKYLNKIFVTAIIPIAIAFSSNQIAVSIKEKELKSKYIEMALDVLKTPPSENRKNMRQWAIQVINKYSEIPLSEEAKAELMKENVLTVIQSSVTVQDTVIRKQ
ncbi:hypothetical protein GHYDROH2_10000 [Geobacter hydrogenophilus]|uniref:Uncharacterized protein n=2 Tax=Geobacter hydrogenophilus TaxID=40983 RepID=A0A9W6LC56_9BACT|nr:hypothetical protein [Geobacter hydrogenophilus]GLI37499.1 hypothetical protein GHYDROH2_10000 [Geobacter hydrogenophilus]